MHKQHPDHPPESQHVRIHVPASPGPGRCHCSICMDETGGGGGGGVVMVIYSSEGWASTISTTAYDDDHDYDDQ